MEEVKLATPEASVFEEHNGGVKFLLGCLDSYSRIEGHIKEATKRAWLMVSWISPGITVFHKEHLWELLEAVAQRGVDVRIIFWHAHFTGMRPFLYPSLLVKVAAGPREILHQNKRAMLPPSSLFLIPLQANMAAGPQKETFHQSEAHVALLSAYPSLKF
jgi:hypothetical protein